MCGVKKFAWEFGTWEKNAARSAEPGGDEKRRGSAEASPAGKRRGSVEAAPPDDSDQEQPTAEEELLPETPPEEKNTTWLWDLPMRCPKFSFTLYEEPVPKLIIDDDAKTMSGISEEGTWEDITDCE